MDNKYNDERKIKYCIEETIIVNSEMSDYEVDEYIRDLAHGKPCSWCDEDDDLLECD